jgi:hypothetical protein
MRVDGEIPDKQIREARRKRKQCPMCGHPSEPFKHKLTTGRTITGIAFVKHYENCYYQNLSDEICRVANRIVKQVKTKP